MTQLHEHKLLFELVNASAVAASLTVQCAWPGACMVGFQGVRTRAWNSATRWCVWLERMRPMYRRACEGYIAPPGFRNLHRQKQILTLRTFPLTAVSFCIFHLHGLSACYVAQESRCMPMRLAEDA
jgi:hypothetical protein